jgi:replicative DNA helicase
MPNLTYRAERAVLGALLDEPGLLNEVGFLNPEDFASEQHREIFRSILAARASDTGRDYPPFAFAVAASAAAPGLSVRYLQSMADTCPHPANVAAYARMVIEAALSRHMLLHAERLFREAGDLHYEVSQASKTPGVDESADAFPAHLLKLAHAMYVHAKRFDPAIEVPDQPSPSPVEDEHQVHQEEEVLAGLLQHPDFNNGVLTWLPAEAFAEGPRREIYQAVTALAQRDDPIDELTVEWQLTGDRAINQPTRGLTREAVAAAGEDAGYVDVLAATPVATTAATMTGRLLLERFTAAQAANVITESTHTAAPADPPPRPVPTPGNPQSEMLKPLPSPAPHSELLEPPAPAPQPGPQPRP